MISSKKHPNSRIVKLLRKPSFIEDAQQKGAPEFMAMSKKSVGSFWENSYSKTVGSGLTFSEQKLLLPTIVDCEPEDRGFRAKVAEYYSNIATKVPFGKDGRDLEIGLENDNKAPVSADNEPLNLADYITYRHAISHPKVSDSKQSSEGNMLTEFYLFDPQAQEDHNVLISADKDKALEMYLKIKKTPEKVDMLLTLLDTDPRVFKGKNAAALKLDKLKEFSESKPSKMIEAFEDNLFEDRYYLQTMINTGVVQKIGERIINPETGVALGNDAMEAIFWLKDKANSETLVLLKARMQEGLKVTPAVGKS